MNHELPVQLSARLEQPLPGWDAHARYQPELSFGRHLGPAPAGARVAAVLVLLYPQADRWHVPLILRPAHMLDHASQVSFPGGMIEPGEDSRQAALREFYEETGAPLEGIELLGELSELYLFASNFRVIPWVATTRDAPHWSPSQCEVERLLEIPLSHLLDPKNTGSMERHHGRIGFSAPCFNWESERIWGATSMILSELLAALDGLNIE